MAKNFGFNIGGGGIADLVAAPKVNPIRSGQFAPTPQFRRDTKEPKKQITGALLGAASPFLAEAGIAGLAKIPGLENLLFTPEAKIKDELGLSPDVRSGAALGPSPYEAERRKRSAQVDVSLPSLKTPQQKTLLGKGLTELLSFAPALALGDDDDGSVAAFISAAQAGKKLEGALDEQRLKAYLARETKRGELKADVGDFDSKISYSAVLQNDGSFAPVKRQVLISPDKTTRYVMSQGNPAVDFVYGEDGNEVPVPRGQYFVREELTLDDNDPGKPKDVKLFDTNSGQIAYGTIEYMQTPQGRTSRVSLQDPRNRRGTNEFTTTASLKEEFGDNWVPYDQELADLDAREKGDPQVFKTFEGRLDREVATFEVAGIASQIIPIAMRAENDDRLLTDVGAVPGFLDKLRKEINAAYNIIGNSGRTVQQIIYDEGQETGSSVSMGKLLIASQNYSQVMNTPGATDAEKEAAKQGLVSALKVVQTRAIDQGADNSLTALDLDSNDFQQLIVDRGMLAAGQLRLAYAAAAADGQTGTSLSDKDVINFLAQLGFGDKNAELVGKKLTGFVVNRLQNFDSREFRDLANNSRTHNPANIQRVNNYLVGTLGVGRGDLATIADPSKSQEEKDKAVSNVFERIALTSRGTAFSDFVYDKENNRIRYRPVLERLQGRERIYNEYMNKIFPHYGITEDEINLVGERETDPLQTGRSSQTPAGELQIRIRTAP
tara:strand:- start:1337 stop:3496 length:2160 start_codon:yes stop_codon:yes gene_type:complete